MQQRVGSRTDIVMASETKLCIHLCVRFPCYHACLLTSRAHRMRTSTIPRTNAAVSKNGLSMKFGAQRLTSNALKPSACSLYHSRCPCNDWRAEAREKKRAQFKTNGTSGRPPLLGTTRGTLKSRRKRGSKRLSNGARFWFCY